MEQDLANTKIDVIIVGAGPSGVSAAMVLAKHGKQVLLIERSNSAGNKNVFGGTVYASQTADIFPDFWETAPIERDIREHKFFLLSDDNSFQASYKVSEDDEKNCFTVNRAKWDKWCVEKAQKLGVIFAPNTLVTKLIKEDNKVVGIETEFEKFYAPLVIIADGVNSLLAKQIGLRKEIKSNDVALSVKETIKLSSEIIEARFNLNHTTGCAGRIVSGPLKDLFAIGFLYTNKDSVSIGFGASIKDLKKQYKTPYEILDEIKAHPTIAPLINGGEIIEYSAHLIPEGGYKKIPRLCDNGVMLVGDAAMFVNNVHFEGTNLAILSGKFAAEVAVEAINKGDFSKKMLSLYETKIKSSIIYKDLKTYSGALEIAQRNTNLLLSYCPWKLCKFFEIFTIADGRPKRNKYRKFIKDIFRERGIFGSFKAMLCFIKLIVGILK